MSEYEMDQEYDASHHRTIGNLHGDNAAARRKQFSVTIPVTPADVS